MATYSFGKDSPLKFEIPDKLAQHYNGAVNEFLKAQQRFNQKFGRRWDPTRDPIAVRWNRKQKWAWNEFAKVLATIPENEGRYHPNDIMDDFLVKNAAETASNASERWGRRLTLIIAGGALYGYFRGR